MNIQRAEALQRSEPTRQDLSAKHDETITVDGLEDLFQWASETMEDGEDGRLRKAREHRIRRQVLEFVQRLREEEALKKANTELSYLQRRAIALLQKLQESITENSILKQVLVSQYFAIQRIPELEKEIELLQSQQAGQNQFEEERKELLTALSRLKKDRDFLDDLLTVNEHENVRVATLLGDAKTELNKIKSRKWWHWLMGRC